MKATKDKVRRGGIAVGERIRRGVRVLASMVLGLVAVLLFGGYIRDINYALQSDFVRLTGHLQIQHKDYFRFGSGNPAAFGIAHYERIMAAVKRDPVLAPFIEGYDLALSAPDNPSTERKRAVLSSFGSSDGLVRTSAKNATKPA